MHILRTLLIFFIAINLISCNSDDDKIEFIILNINDVYEIDALEGGKIGGLARVETLHKKLLKENKNTLLLHGGDFLNPSLLGSMRDENGERYKGRQMIDIMNALNFDLVVFGNHEFDLTLPDLQKRLNESNFKWLGTNVQLKTEESLSPFFVEKKSVKTNISRTVIFDLKDEDGTEIKLGFFGATINSKPNIYVDYGDLYQDAINAYKVLESKTDVVFGLTHLTIQQDKLIANSLPKVPLILGGHEHTNMLVSVGDALISKADANARTAYVHRVTFNKKTRQTTIQSELVTLDESIGEDKEVARLVQQWNVQLDKNLNEILDNPYQVIYRADIPLDGRDTQTRSIQTNLGVIIAEAMFEAFDNTVDCAFVNGGSIRIDDELRGDITGVDIFRVLPFGGGIVKVEMTGKLLEKVLNYGRLKAGTGAYLQRFNVSYNKDTKEWKIGEKKINHSQTYNVAMTDYLLLGLDIPFLKKDNKEVIKVYKNDPNASENDIRKVVIDFLSKKQP